MQVKKRRAAFGFILMLIWNRVSGAASLPGYEFTYRMNGNPEIQPEQVFNDGQDTYFQFSSPDHLPAIFARVGNREFLAPERIQPPYVIVKGLAHHYALKLAGLPGASVDYDGSQNPAHFPLASASLSATAPGTLPPLQALKSLKNSAPMPAPADGKALHAAIRVIYSADSAYSALQDPESGLESTQPLKAKIPEARLILAATIPSVSAENKTPVASLPLFSLKPFVKQVEAKGLKSTGIKNPVPLAPDRFVARVNMRFSRALGQYLQKQGITLQWKYPGDFQLLQSMPFQGKDYQTVISNALNRFHLEGTLYSQSKILVVHAPSHFSGQGE